MTTRQFRVIEQAREQTLHPDHPVEDIALFNADGTMYTASNDEFVPITVAGAIGTAGKTSTADEPEANTLVALKFTSGNSADSATVAFDGGTARAIKLGGTASTGAKLTLAANGVALFFFDGTVLHQCGEYV